MTVWICPECHERLDRGEQSPLQWDTPPGRCWCCGRARLFVVRTEQDDEEEPDS